MKEEQIQRLKKLLSLAERGVGGEAENARRILDQLLDKYNITLDDLRSNNVRERAFPYKTKDEFHLFIQILANIFGTTSEVFTKAKYNTRKKQLYVELSDLDFIDLSNMWSFYRAQFNKERKRLFADMFSAFVMKHNIYSRDPKDPGENSEPDWDRLERIFNLSKSMEDVQYRKALPK